MPASNTVSLSGKAGVTVSTESSVGDSSEEGDAQSGSEEESEDGQVRVTYSQGKKGFAYSKDGKEILLSLEDVFGPGAYSWIASLGIKDGEGLTVTFDTVDGKTVCLLVQYNNDSGRKEWEYDASSRQVVYFHIDGVLAGKPAYVVEEKGGWFRWADDVSADPSRTDQIVHSGLHDEEGRQYAEHFLSQGYFYDAAGILTRVEFYTSTGGAGSEIGLTAVAGRYVYRADTYTAGTAQTAYYNDPYPQDWDPQVQGVIVRDGYGRYFLEAGDGTRWLIIARREDALDGAEFLNTLVLDRLVIDGTEVALTGHEYSNDIIYFDRQQTRIIAVTDGSVLSSNPLEPVVPEVIIEFVDLATTQGDLWLSDNDNTQAVGIVVDPENPHSQAIAWDWEKTNDQWFGWGKVFSGNADLSEEVLEDLVLRFVVSGDAGSVFTVIFEDSAAVRQVNGTTVGNEIAVNASDYAAIDQNLQVIVIPLQELASLNPDFDWSSVKQVKFSPASDKGSVIIRQLQVQDVSALRSRGTGVAVFQDNDFTPINDWYGIKPAFVMSFKDLFDIIDEDILAQLKGVSDNGQVPYLTLEFWQMQVKEPEQAEIEKEKFIQRYGEEAYQLLIDDIAKADILAGIRDGAYDAMIRDYARTIAALDKPVLVRPFHEFNLQWYPWSAGPGREEVFVDAWNRVYAIFQDEHADNALFVFCPYSLNAQGYESTEKILARIKDTVTIIALDGYGPSPESPDGALFNGLFTELIYQLGKYNLPFIIGECGSELNKEQFYREMDRLVRAGALPQLLAVTHFDIAKYERGAWRDFGVKTVAHVIREIQADQFYRVSPEAALEYCRSYEQSAHYYWGGSLSDMRAEVFIDTGASEKRHITASVANDLLSVIAIDSTGAQAYSLDLANGTLKTSSQDLLPYADLEQYLNNVQAMYGLLNETAAVAGEQKQAALVMANYLNAVLYRLKNPDVAAVAMPLLPSTGSTDPNGKITIGFADQTTLFAQDLSDLWAEVQYDGKTEYWDLVPSMISSDGTSIVMEFTPDLNGKSVTMRFYGFDTSGRQTSFSNPIVIQVNSSLSSLVMPAVPSTGTTDAAGKISIPFLNDTALLPDQLSGLWAEVVYDGKTEYWQFYPSMISADGKSMTVRFNPDLDNKVLRMRFYGFDTAGKKTGFTNEITVTVTSALSPVAMPVMPSTAEGVAGQNITLSFVSGQLFAAQLAELWAEVSFDGKTEYWRLHPSMLTADGSAITIRFDPGFSGKILRMRFYGFDPSGKQTSFTNPIDISIQ